MIKRSFDLYYFLFFINFFFQNKNLKTILFYLSYLSKVVLFFLKKNCINEFSAFRSLILYNIIRINI